MSVITVELPLELQVRLDRIAREFGVSVSDLIVDAAHKMSQADALAEIKEKARDRDTRAGFERVLAAVPERSPGQLGDAIE